VLEEDRWEDLPPESVLVRRRGKAVAAYQQWEQAEAHAATFEDLQVWPDNCVGMPPPPPPWVVNNRQQERVALAVEDLKAQWLSGQTWI
jgi:hypothetical protein